MKYHSKLKNKFPHGIMFHHFHDKKKHKKGQGTIDKNQLIKIIKFIGRENILDAESFFKNLVEKRLKKNHVCFTFDDCNPSQYDIAIPVLEKYKIKAFFFFITSPYDGNFDRTELFRFFRLTFFHNMNSFYKKFYEHISADYLNFLKKKEKKILFKKKIYPHYSYEDIKFRLIRDEFLKANEYDQIMFQMFKDFKFEPKKYFKKIFISKKQIRDIQKKGHFIGLHSHNHPTYINSLNHRQQVDEYKTNRVILGKILNKSNNFFKSMSHPCGRYNQVTLKILKKLGIKIGFIERMTKSKNYNNFKIPRQDHSDIISML